MRRATPEDSVLLVDLMSEFYAESGYTVDRGRAATAFSHLLADETLGRVWLLEAEGGVAGYVVLTLGFSMEYGGRDAFVDDLYVRAAFRGRGLGSVTLADMRAACVQLGVRAVHLEVARDNAAARALYRKVGFEDTDRQLLTLRLEEPSHV
jgi:ribosomal protein S18 acetylase RimI-like enzyme